MKPDEYCKNKASRSGSSFYYSFLFLPERQRQAVTALYAFCREVDDIVDECSNTDVARAKLQWWKNEISDLYNGSPQHPVSQALSESLLHFSLEKRYFEDIIDGMLMDLEIFSYNSFEDLKRYCYRVASVVGLLTVEIFGYSDSKTLQYAADLGLAFQLTNIIRDVREDAERGRIYLPQEDLKMFSVSMDDILTFKDSENFRALMHFQSDRAHQYYNQAYSLLPEIDRYAQRGGIIMASIYESLLREMKNDGLDVLRTRTKLTPLRKLWIAWKSQRHEKQRHRQWLQTKMRQS
jgi:phytoene synthase